MANGVTSQGRGWVWACLAASAGCTGHAPGPESEPIAAAASDPAPEQDPAFVAAHQWLEALRKGDEGALHRAAITPTADIAFVSQGFGHDETHCAAQANSAVEFAQQLRCLMRGHSEPTMPSAWGLHMMDSPANTPDAWSRSRSETMRDDITDPTLDVVRWRSRTPGSGGCEYVVGLTDSHAVAAAVRTCWLE